MPQPNRLMFAALVLVSGCGTGSGDVSGTVSFKGEKVPTGMISFILGSQISHGEIHNGMYHVSGVPLGEAAITIVRLDPSQPDPYEALNKVRRQMIERKVADPKEIDAGIVTDTAQLDALQKKRHLLPLAYSRTATSGLRFTVAAGSNSFDIELKENPKAK
jgi:hypothetical protein